FPVRNALTCGTTASVPPTAACRYRRTSSSGSLTPAGSGIERTLSPYGCTAGSASPCFCGADVETPQPPAAASAVASTAATANLRAPPSRPTASRRRGRLRIAAPPVPDDGRLCRAGLFWLPGVFGRAEVRRDQAER